VEGTDVWSMVVVEGPLRSLADAYLALQRATRLPRRTDRLTPPLSPLAPKQGAALEWEEEAEPMDVCHGR
jgi:hypothetical protein